jgi:hypothetical protein
MLLECRITPLDDITSFEPFISIKERYSPTKIVNIIKKDFIKLENLKSIYYF